MSFTIKEAQQILSQKFLLEKGIIGISHASKKLIIYVESEEHASKIPRTLMGFPVETRIIGKIRTLSLPQPKMGKTLQNIHGSRSAKWRPVPGGISIGSIKVTAGTNATRVIDKTTGRKLFLSNRHVFWGDIGTPIIQPGAYDGGTEKDTVAYIERYVEIKSPPEANVIDAAIAEPIDQSIVSDEILDIGIANGITEPKVGDKILKSGRSSGTSTAIITDVNATIKVEGYPDIGEAIFEDTIITTFCGLPGDSGSLAVTADTKAAVGLLFAGSDTVTCFNKITNVCNLLNVDIPTSPSPTPAPAITLLAPTLTGLLMLLITK